MKTISCRQRNYWQDMRAASLGLTLLFFCSSQIFAAEALNYTLTVKMAGDVADPYLEHFEETTTSQPGGWNPGYNGQITTNGTGSAKAIYSASDVWGVVYCDPFEIDLNENNSMRMVVTDVDSDTNNKIILKNVVTEEKVTIAEYFGAGIYNFSIPWTGTKEILIELVAEKGTGGPNSGGTRYDEIWIYNSGSDGYVEHYEEDPGQPGGWYTGHNGQILTNGDDSAKVTFGAGDVWGIVYSDTITLDVDGNNNMRVVVTGVDSGTGNKIFLKETGQDSILISQYFGPGIYNYDIKSITGWEGSKEFIIELIVEQGTAGPATGTRYDEIKIGPAGE